MNNKTINPELVLAGAKLAWPKLDWIVHVNPNAYIFGGCSDKPEVVTKAFNRSFNPLTSGDDFRDLERALKDHKNGAWQFGKTGDDDGYVAWRDGDHHTDPSDTLLLLKCVSAMTGLPLYLEDKQ